ncbi:MAG: hypothetical protein ABEJ80_07545 [Halarchaeum sp.]
MTDTTTDPDRTAGEEDVWSRRSFVRYLAPVSVAVPVVVEGRTLVGLVEEDFAGDESAWNKPTGVSVGVGGELRPETPTREKLSNAALRDTGDGRRLTLAVAAKNTADTPYRFALGAVTTGGGETIDGGATTDELAPGESATLQATYDLPADATPASVETTVTLDGADDAKTVELAVV